MLLPLLISAAFGQDLTAEQRAEIIAKGNPEIIRIIELNPIYNRPYVCGEHWAGQVNFPGDALGQDCMIVGGMDANGFMSLYRSEGKLNEDWYGWQAPVLAPIDGKVTMAMTNETVNSPGTFEKARASGVVIERSDGVTVVIAHIADIAVKQGDVVTAGDQIGTVGNNGFSRSPHTHVGAFDKESALQIRWNLKAYADAIEGTMAQEKH